MNRSERKRLGLRNNYSVVMNGKRQYYNYKFSALNACRIYGLKKVRCERTGKITSLKE